MPVKICVPLLIGHRRVFLLCGGGFGSIALLFEKQNVFKIQLNDSVARIRETAHHSATTRSVHRGGLLPNDLPHEIETDSFTKSDYLGVNGYDFIATIICRASELVTNIYTQAATVVQHTGALRPNEIKVVDIAFVAVVEADLIFGSVILQLPIGWRRDYQMNRFIVQLAHLAAVSVDYFVCCIQGLHFHSWLAFKISRQLVLLQKNK
jgi:hypothetical protein